MRSNKFFIACAALAGAGILLAGAGIAAGGFVTGIQLNSTGLHVYAPGLLEKSGKALYEEKKELLEPFDSVEVAVEYADIRLEASDTDEYAISYCIGTQAGIRYKTENGKLQLTQGEHTIASGPSWFHWFSFGSAQIFTDSQAKEEYVTIYVPRAKKLHTVTLQADSGNTTCENIQADSLKIENDYGNVSLKGLQAGELEADMDSGNLRMQQVTGDQCILENEYGDIRVNGLELTGDMQLSADSGMVEIQDTKLHDLHLDSSYSNIGISQSAFADVHIALESENCVLTDTSFHNCKIQSDYGNVRMKLKEPASSYAYKLYTDYGDITIDGKAMGDSYTSLDKDQDQTRQIQVACESGDIEIE